MISTAIIQPIDMVKVRLQLGDTGGPVRACIYIALPTTPDMLGLADL